MKTSKIISLLSFFLITFSIINATNELSVKDKSMYGSKKGFIEKATLVIEPFGSYVEQSLYLEYSERNQFTSSLLEIVHRFELPKNSVINDLWLWMGDSVMQAQMYDTWSARHIYDSIAATKYDPAFLSKTGSQYELRIYPLAAGKIRKIKLTYITPTKWFGEQAAVELPMPLLLSNNSTQKPLEILFRTKKSNIWGTPYLAELPSLKFTSLLDTLNYSYQHLSMSDISSYSSLNLYFTTKFIDGYYIDGYQDKSYNTYFQLGFLPKDFFKVKIDSTSQNVLVALDFSGSYQKYLPSNINYYEQLVEKSLKPNDKYKLLISGNEKITDLSGTYIQASPTNIQQSFNLFSQSDLAKQIDTYNKKSVLFCDVSASANWNFTNLVNLANVKKFDNINSALDSFTSSDVVAAYEHGFDRAIDQTTADKIILRLDSLFAYGGRFLTYYDYNREGLEKLAIHYITGLKVKFVNHDAVTLYRNPNGNIGINFPESFTRNAAYFFEFNDQDVKVELTDQAGNPTVISKKIKNGLIVVTGIWSLRDDSAMKTLLGAPLLGINEVKKPYMLNKFLTTIKNEHLNNPFSKVILLSDSDSLINKNDASTYAQNYLSGFSKTPPKFFTVNLLQNNLFTPPYITDNQTEYYGTGYLLNVIANSSKGIHLERHLYDWDYIASVFSPYRAPSIVDLKINTSIDDGAGILSEIREINIINDPNKPKFFLAKTNATKYIDFSLSAQFDNQETYINNNFKYIIPHDSTTFNKVVYTMLGNEKINDQFKLNPIDTTTIVKLSMQYNLLTDYTALLALEPDEKFHFLKDPLNEGGFTNIADNNQDNSDSLSVSVYPNPFNNMVTIKINLNSFSNVSANIYNVLGQKVKEVFSSENVKGIKTLTWNGKNNSGENVSSGFYVLRVDVKDNSNNNVKILTQKIVYLK